MVEWDVQIQTLDGWVSKQLYKHKHDAEVLKQTYTQEGFSARVVAFDGIVIMGRQYHYVE